MNWTKYKLVKNFQKIMGRQLKLDRKEGVVSTIDSLIFNKVDSPLVPYYLRFFHDEVKLIVDSERLQKRVFLEIRTFDGVNPFMSFSEKDNLMFLRYLSKKYINSNETV